MKANAVKGLKRLENENRRLKELVAELTLDNHFLKDVLLKRTMTLIDDTTLGNTLRWFYQWKGGLNGTKSRGLVSRSSERNSDG